MYKDDPPEPREPPSPPPGLPPEPPGGVYGGPAQPPIENPPLPGAPPLPPISPPGPNPNNGGTEVLSIDQIGDIPPPPVPRPPPIRGSGVAGIPGTEAGTFALPGTRAAAPFRTSAFATQRPRFGPGVPMVGGSPGVAGLEGEGLGLDPEQAAEILRVLAARRSPQ